MKSVILTWIVSVVFQKNITERLLVVLPFAMSVWEIWGKLQGTSMTNS